MIHMVQLQGRPEARIVPSLAGTVLGILGNGLVQRRSKANKGDHFPGDVR
jgi:hypothetical protein